MSVPFDCDITDFNAARDAAEFEALVASFRLNVPARFNMAASCVSRHARGPIADRIALVCDPGDAPPTRHSYRELDALTERTAAGLASLGVRRGDVVIAYLAQRLEAALVHLACYRLGAIVAPLSLAYGPETLRHILADSDARVLLSERAAYDRIAHLRGAGNRLERVIVVDGARADELPFARLLESAPAVAPIDTAADDPALLLYTSGSTGLPKGILHRHRFILGYLASVSLFYERQMGEPGQVLWTPSDWSWIAGIVNVMMTGWYFGQTVVGGQARVTPEWIFGFMARHGVTHTFLTPTALKRMAEEVGGRSA